MYPPHSGQILSSGRCFLTLDPFDPVAAAAINWVAAFEYDACPITQYAMRIDQRGRWSPVLLQTEIYGLVIRHDVPPYGLTRLVRLLSLTIDVGTEL